MGGSKVGRCPQLARLAANSKLLGVRHIVQSEPDDRFLLQPEFLRGISMLAEFGLSFDILIHARQLPVAAELVSRFPDQRFVLDHLANPPIKDGSLQTWKNNIRNLARFPNVVCKVSGLVTEADWKRWELAHLAPYIEVALDCFDPERLMIGSDRPVCTLAASYLQVIDAMQEFLSQYPPSVSNAVLGGTASNFWELTTRTKDSHAGVDTGEVLAEKSELRQSENRL